MSLLTLAGRMWYNDKWVTPAQANPGFVCGKPAGNVHVTLGNGRYGFSGAKFEFMSISRPAKPKKGPSPSAPSAPFPAPGLLLRARTR